MGLLPFFDACTQVLIFPLWARRPSRHTLTLAHPLSHFFAIDHTRDRDVHLLSKQLSVRGDWELRAMFQPGAVTAASPVRSPVPRSAPPSVEYVQRSRRSSHKLNKAEMLARYEAMRAQLTQLAATGVLDDSARFRTETPSDHLRMAARHLRRVCMLSAVAIVSRLRNRPSPASEGGYRRLDDEHADGEVGDGDPSVDISPALDSSPDLRTLGKHGLIMPTDSLKQKWDLLILVLILYSAAVVPLRVCFQAPALGFLWYLEVTMTIAFLYDVYLNFNTVTFDSQSGKWVTNRTTIAKNYMTSWFWIDGPSSVPVELISLFVDAQSLSVLRVLRILRLIRLAKLLKIEEYIETLENHFDINLRLLRIVFMIVKMCFLGHIMGCLWYGMSLFSASEKDLEATGDTWRATYADGVVISPNATTALQYMIAIYWSVTTMTTVGYGDFVPINDGETWYALSAMMISSLIFGYMISNVGVLVASMDRQAALVEEKTDAAKEYVAFRNLPKAMAMRVKKHFSLYYQSKAGFDEIELLEGLSPSLSSEVRRFVLKGTLGRLPLFASTLDTEFQLEVFPYIKPVSYAKGEIIFRKGEASRDLMFLLSGEVSILSPIEKDRIIAVLSQQTEYMLAPNGEPLVALDNPGCFGESVILGLRRPATHVATRWCETLCLAKDDLSHLFAKNKRAGVKIVTTLLKAAGRRQRLQGMMTRFMINALPKSSDVRAAMIVQRAWQRTAMRLSKQTAPYATLMEPSLTPEQQARVKVLEHACTRILGAIADMRAQLKAGKLDLRHGSWVPKMRRAESIVLQQLIDSGRPGETPRR